MWAPPPFYWNAEVPLYATSVNAQDFIDIKNRQVGLLTQSMSGGQGEILTAFLFLQICIIFSFYFHFCKESKSSDGEMEKEIKDKKI